jgi:hypothetical protein
VAKLSETLPERATDLARADHCNGVSLRKRDTETGGQGYGYGCEQCGSAIHDGGGL